MKEIHGRGLIGYNREGYGFAPAAWRSAKLSRGIGGYGVMATVSEMAFVDELAKQASQEKSKDELAGLEATAILEAELVTRAAAAEDQANNSLTAV